MKSARSAKKPRVRRTVGAIRTKGALPGAAETRRILEDLPVAVVVATLGENPRVLFLNRQFIKTFGYTLDDIPTEEDWARRAYPDAAYRKKVFTRWGKALESAARVRGRVESMEFRVVNKDGRTMDILFNAIVLGRTVQITLTDLTPRREAERALRTARRRLERTAVEVTEKIPVGTVALHIDARGKQRYVFTSERWLKMLDLDREAVMADHSLSIERIHPEDRADFERQSRNRSLASGRFFWEGRMLVRGEVIWVSIESVGQDLGGGESLWWGIMTDNTARRAAEEELRSAREQLERTAYEVTENIPAGTYTMILKPGDPMARFTFMSSRFLELCGLDRQAAEENPLNAFACVHPDDYDEWVRKNAECFGKKIPFAEECRLVAHGVTRWIRAESAPRDLPDGSVVWEGVLTDITPRKIAEQRAAAGEARLRKILDNIPIPVALNEARKDGHITFLNEAFIRTFGYNRQDLPDVGAWARLAYPDEAYRRATFETWDAAVAEAARTDGVVRPIEFHVNAKDGSRRDVLISAAVFDDQLLVGFVDLTARRRAEEELRSAREKLQRTAYELTENIPVGTYVLETDATGDAHFTFTSERWLKMLDLRRADIQSDPSLAFQAVHPDDREDFLRLNARVLASHQRFYWEGRIVVRGETRWVTIESVPREQPDGRVVWEGVMVDITARRRAEAELAALREAELGREKQRRENLEAKLRASLAAAAAAHEINQPLSRILLTSRLVMKHEEESPRGDSRVSGFVRSLAGEAQSVVETIEKMKSLMRNTGTARERIDLRDLAESAILYAGSFARPVGAHIAFDRPAHPASIEADADQIQVALNNLLRNAIEAVAELPARHPRDIRVELRRRRNALELVVGDSGPGWPPDADPDDLPESTKPGGTGLGLFIVRTAAENHGARLELARSELGGAELRLIFPKPAKKQ